MICIKDIIDYTETFAPLSTAMDFDNSGLLVGSENTAVTRALVALDITDGVIDEALALGAELIISHHPVIFNPIKAVEADSIVYRLAQNNLAALCLHTNLDLSPVFGVNLCLAQAAGVKNGAFVPGECLFVGELDREMTNREFALRVKTALSCSGLRYTLGDKRVKKIALCSGSGGDYASLAKKMGADALLTGEVRHHEILDALKRNIALVDAGHFKTEDVVTAPLCEKLSAEFPQTEFRKSQCCTDGVEFA